jgi:ribosome-associated toxin RatA of RatAB toxin-antitoxin module
MAHINRSALLPYPAQAIYELVNDIEAYPQYMDGCVGATILKRDDDVIEARLDLARGAIRYSFTTRNRLDAPKSIQMDLIDGPFTQFEGRWFFQTLNENACKVILDLQFSMSNSLVSLAAKKLFDGVANNLVDALCKRANALYGQKR